MKLIFYISFIILISSFNNLSAEESLYSDSRITFSIIDTSDNNEIDEDEVIFVYVKGSFITIEYYITRTFNNLSVISKDKHIPPDQTSI